ncbi:hypothetical protein ACFUJU_13485 [Streptomyces sp. NPDC057235]|uniref:hypothetical protein n=1 Tax=Streptomyces sp. NPDC057235 TaxID=3346058 RepID=UPI003625573F
MRTRTLARHSHPTGWAHPYATGPFDPWLYADGGDGDDSGSSDTAGDGDDDGSTDDDTGDDGQDGDSGDTTDTAGRKPAPKPAPPKGGKSGDDPAAQVARLTKELEDARKDAGKARTEAKRQAAEEAKASLVQELGKALGLVKDDDKDAAPPDPAKLTAEIERATAAHRQTATELAVFKGASKHGADPDSLTDSRAFMSKLAKLDPNADDFNKKVGEAIKTAVADNPKLKAAGQVSAASASGEFTGGTGEPDTNGPQSIDDIRAARRKRRAG